MQQWVCVCACMPVCVCVCVCVSKVEKRENKGRYKSPHISHLL